MRVPLPGRDYFPPRVLLNGIRRTSQAVLAMESRSAPPALRPVPLPVRMPASPPMPMTGLQPAA